LDDQVVEAHLGQRLVDGSLRFVDVRAGGENEGGEDGGEEEASALHGSSFGWAARRDAAREELPEQQAGQSRRPPKRNVFARMDA